MSDIPARYGTDPRRFGPSKFTREQAKEWSRWLHDPRGTDPGRDAGSRSRPMSIGSADAEVDEIYERMLKRGMCAPEELSSAKADGAGGDRRTTIADERGAEIASAGEFDCDCRICEERAKEAQHDG